MSQSVPGGFPPPPAPPKSRTPRWVIAVIVAGTLVALACFGGMATVLIRGVAADDDAPRARAPLAVPGPRTPATASPVPIVPDGPPPADKTYEGRGTKVLELSLDEDYKHIAKITHNGSRNFMVESRDATDDYVDLVVNEVGDYDGLRPLDFDREQPASLRIRADGSWKVTVMSADKAPKFTGKASGKAGGVLLAVDPAAPDQNVRFTHKGRSNVALSLRGEEYPDLLVNEIGQYSGDMVVPTGTRYIDIDASGSWTLTTR